MGQNAKKYKWLGIFLLLLIIISGGYALGFRLGGKYLIGKVGVVSMTIPTQNTSIYIDESNKITTSKINEEVKTEVSPGEHTFIVSGNGYFPWKKSIDVANGAKVSLSPIFVSTNTSGLLIGQSDPEYQKIINSISKNIVPTKTSPKISNDGTTSVWVEDGAIVAKVVNDIHVVIEPQTIIRNVDFYKDRSDAVIFSTSDSVYVIEISKEGTQNFIPIYKGTSPAFVTVDTNSIYVSDEKSLMQVAI